MLAQSPKYSRMLAVSTKSLAVLPFLFLFNVRSSHGQSEQPIIFSGHVRQMTIVLGKKSILDTQVQGQSPKEGFIKALSRGMNKLGCDTSERSFQKGLKKAANRFSKKGHIAYTRWNNTWKYTFRTSRGKFKSAYIKYVDRVVILHGSKASKTLINHEKGHALIRYLYVNHLKKEFDGYGDKLKEKSGKEVVKLIGTIIKSLGKTADSASEQFDNVTNHSKVGGENQQKIANQEWLKALKQL